MKRGKDKCLLGIDGQWVRVGRPLRESQVGTKRELQRVTMGRGCREEEDGFAVTVDSAVGIDAIGAFSGVSSTTFPASDFYV